ncbi:MAG TPA: helix-turn-helix transcriptional regulator [Noviherbaspirillum sp.]|nr:helix-turn-helix transcriptional regulator [Noviherbaspirillum sp.]
MMEYRLAVAQHLAVLLKSLRKQRKLSQHELGERLGISQRMVAKIEANPDTSSFGRIFQLLNALDVDIVLKERSPQLPETSSRQNDEGTAAW